jgi:hypothetical protein
MRVVKNLYEAARLSGVSFTTDPLEAYDVAHFVSTKAEKFIKNALLRKVPVIISALMSENDPDARLLSKKDGKWDISYRDLSILQSATLVIVPTASGKDDLDPPRSHHPIDVLSEGIIKARYNHEHEIEKGIFRATSATIRPGPGHRPRPLFQRKRIARLYRHRPSVPACRFLLLRAAAQSLVVLVFQEGIPPRAGQRPLKKTVHEDVYRSLY